MGDTVTITRAEWKSGELRIEATGSNASATLTAYLPSGASLGALPDSGGQYRGTFRLATQPASVTVRSSLGGSWGTAP